MRTLLLRLRSLFDRSPQQLEREAQTLASYALVDENQRRFPDAQDRWSAAARLLEESARGTANLAEWMHRRRWAVDCWRAVARCADRAGDTVPERCAR